ncbi:YfbU family protein [Rhizobium leguminosarum]|uniref:YfbU family protein n=1 Tax=Rhizobium leguminosarum TaxID=384 RepID=UPI001AEB2F83|nr:YfbU family protein [Rhizobium leguminosarum]MBP2444844.1 uncharacterized protein YfbU (UPF0304 family) [Rhizobium leguminosarum]
MSLTDGERLIALLLAELHESVGNATLGKTVKTALASGNAWALQRVMPISMNDEIGSDIVQETRDTLDMWWDLEEGYSKLGVLEKAALKTSAYPFGHDVKFEGWDVTRGDKHADVAHFLTTVLGEYEHFKGRSFDSHSPGSLGSYQRMLPVFRSIRNADGFSGWKSDTLAKVLLSRTHPSSANL